MSDHPYYDFGKRLVEILHHLPEGTVDKAASYSDTVWEHGDQVKQALCLIGANVLRTHGHNDLVVDLMEKLATEQSWNPVFDPLAESVCLALGQETLAMDQDVNIEVSEKLASLSVPLATMALGTKVIPLAAMTGGALGASAFMAKRLVDEDSDENEAIQAKTDFYRRLNSSLEAELRRKGLLEDEDIKRIAEEHRKDLLIERANAVAQQPSNADLSPVMALAGTP